MIFTVEMWESTNQEVALQGHFAQMATARVQPNQYGFLTKFLDFRDNSYVSLSTYVCSIRPAGDSAPMRHCNATLSFMTKSASNSSIEFPVSLNVLIQSTWS